MTTSIPISTQGSDFNSSNRPAPLRTMGAIFGNPGTGKTYLLLNELPQPVCYFWFDNRSHDELEKARNMGRQILDIQIVVPPSTLSKDELQKECQNLWEKKIIPNLIWAAKKSETEEIRSIAFDTATEATDIINYRYNGNLRPEKGGGKTGDANRQWLRVADIVRSHKANLMFTTRESEIWDDSANNGWGKGTGQFKPRCPAGLVQAVDWSCHLRFQRNLLGKTLNQVEMEVLKSGINREAMAKIAKEEEWKDIGLTSFQYLMTQIFEKGDTSDWKP